MASCWVQNGSGTADANVNDIDKLDNDIIGEANYQTFGWVPIPGVSVPIRSVPAGNHTLTAVWSSRRER